MKTLRLLLGGSKNIGSPNHRVSEGFWKSFQKVTLDVFVENTIDMFRKDLVFSTLSPLSPRRRVYLD